MASRSADVVSDDAAASAASALPWRAPDLVDAGLLVIHGAGTHPRITTLNEMLNPTLARLRDEGVLKSSAAIRIGGGDVPGGHHDGLIVEYYTDRPKPEAGSGDAPRAQTEAARKLLVLEGRWHESYIDPPLREVSAWSVIHAGRLSWEIAVYHMRGPAFVITAFVVLAMISAGIAVIRDAYWLGVGLILGGWGVAYLVALFDATSSWNERDETVAPRRTEDRGGQVRRHWLSWRAWRDWLWVALIAVTMMVYHVQRGIVLLLTLAGIVLVPLIVTLVRIIGTVPFLDGLAKGVIGNVERSLLREAPTDTEVISSNAVAASAIQTRIRAALLEIESRVKAGGTITVFVHSAGTPTAWWLLSEPDIHERQKTKRFRYRLISVAGILNWSKRGMDCRATPLDMELVNSTQPVIENRTYWANVYSTWDPAPHGPVRREEFAGQWNSWSGSEPRADPKVPFIQRIAMTVFARLPGAQAGRADDRPDPNFVVRNLGTPISAEHSEYFRNQQEFVPLLVNAIDSEIQWAVEATLPERRKALANARLALLSPLVRTRMAVFSVPIALLIACILDEPAVGTCVDAEGTGYVPMLRRGRDGVPGWFADRLDAIYTNVPLFGDISGKVCKDAAYISIEDLVLVVMSALVAYALMESYTAVGWQNLGRRVHTLDPRFDLPHRWWPFSRWRVGKLPFWSAFFVWVPTLFTPLLFFSLYWGMIWYGLVAGTLLLSVLEGWWFEHCLRGIEDPTRFRETQLMVGRYHVRAS